MENIWWWWKGVDQRDVNKKYVIYTKLVDHTPVQFLQVLRPRITT